LNKLTVLFVLAAALLMNGCMRAGGSAFEDARQLIAAGHYEQGLAAAEQVSRENPADLEFKAYYIRQRDLYVALLISQADAARANRQYAQAEFLYQRVANYDPNNRRAAEGLSQIPADKRHDDAVDKAEKLLKGGKTEEANSLVRSVLAEDPRHVGALDLLKRIDDTIAAQKALVPGLGAAFKRPITLEFRDAGIKAIFEVISRATNINFIFDRDVRPDLKSTIFVKNTTIEDVVNLLMVTNQLEKRVLNENTVLIYPNTPAKSKDYQDLVVKAFYLANADVKQTLNMIKTLVKTRDVFIDEKLNLLVMKDTPEAIRLAEKLIVTQDRAEPEVMLEVEVLEVKRGRLLELGVQWPNQFTALNIGTQSTSTQIGTAPVVTTGVQTQNIVTVETLRNLTGSNIAIAPNLQVKLKKEDGDAQILANPRIRVKNKEKAKVHIGEKVPVITTTVTANVGVSESVNYLDVGLKLDVEPNISLDNEVSIKVGLEVSSIVREIRSATGTTTYQVGTRNAATHLRLKDGETQVLAGLISDEDRKNASKIPLLGELPLLGHLFSTQRDESSKTEIVLLITPRILGNLSRMDVAATEFASGTEAAVGVPPLVLRAAPSLEPTIKVSSSGGPAPSPAAAAPVTQPAGSPITPIPAGHPAGAPRPVSAPLGSVALSAIAPPQVIRGQEFNVVINAASSVDTQSLAFDLLYDPEQMEVVRVVEGAYLKQGNGTTQFEGSPVEGSGRLRLSVKRDSGGAKGAGAIAIVVMRSVAGGQAPQGSLSIESPVAADVSGQALNLALPAPVIVNFTK